MGKVSGVSWCDASWGPWRGCTKVSEECRNCYAEREMTKHGFPFGTLTRSKTTFMAPLFWPEPLTVFVCPWGDFFHPDVPPSWRGEAWDVMRKAARHVYIIPTKRPELILQMLPSDWGDSWSHVWLLVSAGTQTSLERFWPELEKVPVAVRGISVEPLLESLDLEFTRLVQGDRIVQPGWVIVSGESGPRRRLMNPVWARGVRDWCKGRGVPFYFKGWVGNAHSVENGLLDGQEWHEYPSASRV